MAGATELTEGKERNVGSRLKNVVVVESGPEEFEVIPALRLKYLYANPQFKEALGDVVLGSLKDLETKCQVRRAKDLSS